MPCPVDPQTAANAVFNPSSGSSIGNMGIGLLGAADTLLKRKFRFLFGIQYCTGTASNQKSVGASFVKTASRPDITIEDTELNFLNEVTWIPGKAKWETITVTYYDAAVQQTLVCSVGSLPSMTLPASAASWLPSPRITLVSPAWSCSTVAVIHSNSGSCRTFGRPRLSSAKLITVAPKSPKLN